MDAAPSWEDCLPMQCNRDASCDTAFGNGASRRETASTDSPCCVDVLVDILRSVVSVLELHFMPHVIYYGALLGQARGDSVIPWTSDLDILLPGFVMDRLESNTMQQELRKAGVLFWRDSDQPDLARFCVADSDRLGSDSSTQESTDTRIRTVPSYSRVDLKRAVQYEVRSSYYR